MGILATPALVATRSNPSSCKMVATCSSSCGVRGACSNATAAWRNPAARARRASLRTCASSSAMVIRPSAPRRPRTLNTPRTTVGGKRGTKSNNPSRCCEPMANNPSNPSLTNAATGSVLPSRSALVPRVVPTRNSSVPSGILGGVPDMSRAASTGASSPDFKSKNDESVSAPESTAPGEFRPADEPVHGMVTTQQLFAPYASSTRRSEPSAATAVIPTSAGAAHGGRAVNTYCGCAVPDVGFPTRVASVRTRPSVKILILRRVPSGAMPTQSAKVPPISTPIRQPSPFIPRSRVSSGGRHPHHLPK